jgi:hypothetical protein
MNSKFFCKDCNLSFINKSNLNTHLDICKKYIIRIYQDECKLKLETKDKEKEDLILQYKKEINDLCVSKEEKIKDLHSEYKLKLQERKREIDNLILQHKKEISDLSISKDEKIKDLQSHLEKMFSTIEKLASKSIDKLQDSVREDSQNVDIETPIPLMEQMRSIIIEEVKDDVKDNMEYSNITLNDMVISSRPIDHYINATQLCQAGGKFFKDWFRLESTKELINELSADGRILPSGLVETKRGGNDKSKQGSWIHPDLSIQLAQWISPKFAIQVSKWIRSLFSVGSVEIDLTLLRDKDRDIQLKDHRIKQLESVCLSKQRRVEYPEKNVIYILTTDDHIKRHTYIIGKAKNLMQRLSTYNKTCDHTVVHYRECKSEEDMSTAEIIILNKLKDYREQANRDRFILPYDKDVSFFTTVIDKCIEFI